MAFVLAVGVGAVAFGAGTTLSASERNRDEGLATRGIQTSGVVTAIDASDHGTASYTFTDENGVGRSGAGSVSGPNPRPAPGDLSRGSGILVTYDKQDPRLSCVCDPAADLQNVRRHNLTLALVIGVAVLGLSFATLAVRRVRSEIDDREVRRKFFSAFGVVGFGAFFALIGLGILLGPLSQGFEFGGLVVPIGLVVAGVAVRLPAARRINKLNLSPRPHL